jgi:hypothetical protein
VRAGGWRNEPDEETRMLLSIAALKAQKNAINETQRILFEPLDYCRETFIFMSIFATSDVNFYSLKRRFCIVLVDFGAELLLFL